MRILITNNTLSYRAGTELYARDVALELAARGHEVAAFTLEPGEVALELTAAGIPVTDDLRALPWLPEVIHGHHQIETTLAALAFPRVPVLSFCHGPRAWQESPCRQPSVVRWIAVDEACRARVTEREGIPDDRVTVLLNFVDLRRIADRPPLPDRPRRALVFSNYLKEDDPAVAAVSEVCGRAGIALTCAGAAFRAPVASPGALLPQFDIVFAKARSALEAMAAGCAVIQLDHFGAGRLVTQAVYDELRPLNFGWASMTWPIAADHLAAELAKYDAADAAAVSRRVREEASLVRAVDALEELYRQAAQREIPDADPIAAAGDFLRLHALWAKRYVQSIRKTEGVALWPLPPPYPPGTLVAAADSVAEGHVTAAKTIQDLRKRVRTLESKLDEAKQAAKTAARPPADKPRKRRWPWRGKRNPPP